MTASGNCAPAAAPGDTVNRRNIYLEVTGYAGSDVHDCMNEMIALATRLNIDVWCPLNGVTVLARPSDNKILLHKAWELAIAKKQESAST